MNPANLNTRVRVLEEKLMGNETAIIKLETKVDRLQEGQIRLLEKISDLQAHMDARISALQAHTDHRFLEMGRDFAKEFGRVHTDMTGLHGQINDIHKSISMQTKWFLAVVLFATAAIPALFKVLDHFL